MDPASPVTSEDNIPVPASPPAISIEQAIEAFLADIAAGHSPATARTYRIGLSRLTTYLQSHLEIKPDEYPIAQLQPDWAVGCVRWLIAGQPAKDISSSQLEKKVPKTTIATYIASFSRFYKWCMVERLLVLPLEDYERMVIRFKDLRGKVQRTIIDKVPADEVLDALLKAVREAPSEPVEEEQPPETAFRGDSARLRELDQKRYELLQLRNIALVETLKCTGARISEVVGLKRGDIDATNRRARVVGKGSKERWVYFSPSAWEAINLYLKTRARVMLEIGSGEAETNEARGRRKAASVRGRAIEVAAQPVFARHDRGAGWKKIKPLLPHAVGTMLWELVEKAGLDVSITPHKFRHWFATRMLAATGDLATTQDLLGHANPATTRIYAQVSENKKQSAHRQVFGDL